MLDSSSWNEILDELSRVYLSVYEKANPHRPIWLDQREELSHFVLSLSTDPLTKGEISAIASRISGEHGRFNEVCKTWASAEVKWLLRYLSKAPTLMAGFMALPGELKLSPGDVAPAGHSMHGRPMRVAMAHSMFIVIASSRRVAPIAQVRDQTLGAEDDMKGFTTHADGSVSKTKAGDNDADLAPDPAGADAASEVGPWTATIKEE